MGSLLPADLAHGRADVGEISLHYVELGAGDDGTNRPLVLLCHGFSTSGTPGATS